MREVFCALILKCLLPDARRHSEGIFETEPFADFRNRPNASAAVLQRADLLEVGLRPREIVVQLCLAQRDPGFADFYLCLRVCCRGCSKRLGEGRLEVLD